MSKPYPYRDFVRVQAVIESAILAAENADPYLLVVGETGSGKTALLQQIKAKLDRSRFKVCYFSEAPRLGAPGLVRVVAEALRVRCAMFHSLTFDRVLHALADETTKLLLWLDEAHNLPHETLDEARALVEADLDGARHVQVLFTGLPRFAANLKQQTHLWRRIFVREELLGLVRDEMGDFVSHHFGATTAKRLCEKGLGAIFESGKGSPGLLLNILRPLVAEAQGKGAIDVEQITAFLARMTLE